MNSRSVVFKEMPEFKYQATLVWPQSSKKPSGVTLLSADEMNQTLVRFSVNVSNPGFTSVSSGAAAKYSSLFGSSSGSPTPSQASNGSAATQIRGGTSGMAMNSFISGGNANGILDKSSKLNYDVPLEELLDDSGDDLDNEAEILGWIKDFLYSELGGKLGGNVPMLLMNNIRSLGSDELVLQVIIILTYKKDLVFFNLVKVTKIENWRQLPVPPKIC